MLYDPKWEKQVPTTTFQLEAPKALAKGAVAVTLELAIDEVLGKSFLAADVFTGLGRPFCPRGEQFGVLGESLGIACGTLLRIVVNAGELPAHLFDPRQDQWHVLSDPFWHLILTRSGRES